jgi:hypothetical protein
MVAAVLVAPAPGPVVPVTPVPVVAMLVIPVPVLVAIMPVAIMLVVVAFFRAIVSGAGRAVPATVVPVAVVPPIAIPAPTRRGQPLGRARWRGGWPRRGGLRSALGLPVRRIRRIRRAGRRRSLDAAVAGRAGGGGRGRGGRAADGFAGTVGHHHDRRVGPVTEDRAGARLGVIHRCGADREDDQRGR